MSDRKSPQLTAPSLNGGWSIIKRQLWCRWFHRWHPALHGGWTRHYCHACENHWHTKTVGHPQP